MRVYTYPQDWYPDDINSKLNFNEFSDTKNDGAGLFIGLQPTYDPELQKFIKTFKRSVYLNLEHPCTLYSEPNQIGLDGIQQQAIFNEVYTICPYTADWLNADPNIQTKFSAVPYMHNLKYNIYHTNEKLYDVVYTGLIHHVEIAKYIKAIKNFSYVFCNIPHYNRTHAVDHLITHMNIPNTEKWEIMSRTKIALIQNNLYLTPQQKSYVKTLPNWQNNQAFSHLHTSVIPQLKSRTVESALCKNLMLVKRDHWNVIEHWFKPDEDFVYFDNADDLGRKLKELLSEYHTSHIQNMIESAYKKTVLFYNTKHIYAKIKNGEAML